MKRNWCLTAIIGSVMAAAPAALADGDIGLGVSAVQDGSFNYQGYMEFEGAPANGDFYFEVHLLDSNGDEIDPRFDTPGPITVTDGLFDMDIQMGGTPADAEFFWKRYGHLAKKMRIMVGVVEGGPYTTLSPDVDLGSSPHALNARYADALRFPYSDVHSNTFADSETMISLTNEFGGTVLELAVGVERVDPALRVSGTTLFDDSIFGNLRGAVQINSESEPVGLLSISNQFPVLGWSFSATAGNHASILGEVQSTANPSIIAVWALNDASGNDAALGTGSYSGDFNRDVLVRRDLRVQGEPTRDYDFNMPSPIGPLAYGSVSAVGAVTAGTANLSATWDAANSQYILGVAGEIMTFSTHTVSVTVVDAFEPRLATFSNSGGDIVVKIWDLNSGNAVVQDNFSIVIYDANPVVLNRLAVPDGVDLDKHSEKTGAQLIQTRPRHEPVVPFENYGSGASDD